MDLLGRAKNRMFNNPYLIERAQGVAWAQGFGDFVPGYQLAWLNEQAAAARKFEADRIAKEQAVAAAAYELQSVAGDEIESAIKEQKAQAPLDTVRQQTNDAQLPDLATEQRTKKIADEKQIARSLKGKIVIKLPVARRRGQIVKLITPSAYVSVR